MSSLSHRDDWSRISTALVLGLLLASGLWLRVRHLDKLGLVVDEGLQMLAVRGILEHGVPQLDSGLTYPRGLPLLYTQAAAAKVFGLNEFSLRLPGALLSVVTILVSYIVGKMLCDRRVGLLTAIVMAYSVWEIELARYARTYSIFQLLYLVSFLCFYRGFLRDERQYRVWFAIAAFFTFSVHELGLCLVSWFLLPLLSQTYTPRQKVIWGVWILGLVVAYFLYLRVFDFYTIVAGVAPHEAAGTTARGILEQIRATFAERIAMPEIEVVLQAAQQQPFLFGGLTLAAGMATLVVLVRSLRQPREWRMLHAIPMIWAAVLAQFGLIGLLAVVYVVFYGKNLRSLRDPVLLVAYGAVGVSFVFWLPAIIATPKPLLYAMFGYPRFFQYFLSWLAMGWPLLTVVFGIGCVRLLSRFLADRPAREPVALLGAVLVPVLFVSFLRRGYYEARYIFHLYPLIIIVFTMTLVELAECFTKTLAARFLGHGILFSLLVVTALLLSQDANPLNAWAISNRDYQSARDPIRGPINWTFYAGFHQDLKSPSLYVREHLGSGDRVLVLGAPHMVAIYYYYVGKVDYTVGRLEDARHHLKTEKERIIDYITGVEVLENLAQVRQVIEDSSPGGLWLLGDRLLLVAKNQSYPEDVKAYFSELASNPNSVGFDGQTFAVKIR